MTPQGLTRTAAVLAAALTAVCGAGASSHADPAGKTTRHESIVPGAALDPAKPGFLRLVPGAADSASFARCSRA